MREQLKHCRALPKARPVALPNALWIAPLLALLVGCGDVLVKPDQSLPKALLVPIESQSGVVLTGELRNYKHEESRGGTNWVVDLGPGHVRMVEQMFEASFKSPRIYSNLDEAKAAPGLNVLFLPAIEQYSFATARDTSGGYWAVTIRYRIGVYTPQGEEADSLTLTGYGSSLSKGGAGTSLQRATVAAMRDAASKFLVQMPRQQMAGALRRGESISAGRPATLPDEIETVAIEAATVAAR